MELVAERLDSIIVLAIFAVSFNLLSGYSGQLSVAHAAFGAVGGYTLARLFLSDGTQFLLGAGIGIVFAAVVALVIGAVALRLSSEWLMLMTFAVGVVVVSLATTSSSLGGTYGLLGITGLSVFGHKLDTPEQMLPVFAIIGVLVYAICHRLGESPFGRVLRGIREDELAARSLGKNASAYKLLVFVITGAMAGLAGELMVVQTTVASPTLFDLALATVIVSAVVIGGSGNLVGSVLAAALIVMSTPFLESVLSLSPTTASLWQLVLYGTALIVVLFVRPEGLLPEGFNPLRRTPAVDRGAVPEPTLAAVRPEAPPAPEQGLPILEVSGLSKRFGSIVAADDLDFTLTEGAISAVVGPNGAGKTTLFNLLTGTIPPDAGSVRLRGEEVVGLGPDRVARLGMVRSFQDVRIFPRLSVLDNVVLGVPEQPGERVGPLFGRPRRVRAREREARELAHRWLEFVGLDQLAAAKAHDLGFGQQKLISFARVLATEAPVLLLDEPASGIDVRWLEQIVELIHRARAEGRTICIVEHNLEVVENVADDVAFMELGRITARGSFAELTSEAHLAEAYFGG
ncbi:MAG TPA: ATP-binding cassette domain-containing protein [Solirubrobacterales bacterium]|jgi:branched-chain amino acid transport system permease protein